MSLVDVTDVSREFGELTAVDAINLSLGRGEILGLLGANGAGKTTLIRMILGLLSSSAGRIDVLGLPVREIDMAEIGYVPQSLGLYKDLTVGENLEFVTAAFGVGHPNLGTALASVTDRRVGDISLGLRRRAAFEAAICHRPSILILDEPTSGVGPLGRAALWEMIHDSADGGAGVLVTTHYMEEAEECDRVVVMASGRDVANGPVSDIVGTRTVVRVSDLGEESLQRLRDEGMTLLAAGAEWRVVGASADEVRAVVGGDGAVEQVPATFEEAFFELSR